MQILYKISEIVLFEKVKKSPYQNLLYFLSYLLQLLTVTLHSQLQLRNLIALEQSLQLVGDTDRLRFVQSSFFALPLFLLPRLSQFLLFLTIYFVQFDQPLANRSPQLFAEFLQRARSRGECEFLLCFSDFMSLLRQLHLIVDRGLHISLRVGEQFINLFRYLSFFLLLHCYAATHLSLQIVSWTLAVNLLHRFASFEESLIGYELAIVNRIFSFAGQVDHLLAGIDSSIAVPIEPTAPLQQFNCLLYRTYVDRSFPVVHFALDHCQKGHYKLLLSLFTILEWHLRLVAKKIFIYPNSHFSSLQCYHLIGWPKIPEMSSQSHKSFKNSQQLLVGIAQSARIELFKEISTEFGSLQQKPSIAGVRHLHQRDVCSCDVVSGCVRLVETRGRTEEGLPEPQVFEIEGNGVMFVQV